MRIIVAIGIGVFLLILISYVIFSPKQSTPLSASPTSTQSITQAINKQATFAIYTNGTLRIFTDPRYHNKSNDVYLEANNPSLIHVKKAGITWGDFFASLPMKVTAECLITGTGQEFCTNDTHRLKFYINTKETPDALSREIQSEDKLLVSYGPTSDPAIKDQLQKIRQ